jgi:hypothetical protein
MPMICLAQINFLEKPSALAHAHDLSSTDHCFRKKHLCQTDSTKLATSLSFRLNILSFYITFITMAVLTGPVAHYNIEASTNESCADRHLILLQLCHPRAKVHPRVQLLHQLVVRPSQVDVNVPGLVRRNAVTTALHPGLFRCSVVNTALRVVALFATAPSAVTLSLSPLLPYVTPRRRRKTTTPRRRRRGG